ncbi:MAG: hypothetical protein OSA89_19450 [Mariniblastus sp.]|nr:hypothetical protein [Mariniblastus sp.]
MNTRIRTTDIRTTRRKRHWLRNHFVRFQIIALTISYFSSLPSICLAQADRPRVVTVDTGVQFEGEVFTVRELSTSTTSYNAYGSSRDNIVVITDGLRRVFIGDNHVLNLGDSGQSDEINFDIDQKSYNGSEGNGAFVGVGPFNQYGHRQFSINVRLPDKTSIRRTYTQGITKITPRYCVLKTLVGNPTAPLKQWTMHIATGTVPKNVLRNVLLSRVKNPNKPEEFFDIAYLFQQMGDYKLASEELRQIESKFPGLKEQIRDQRDKIGQLKARQILREIDLRKDSGQFDLALQMAKVPAKERLAGEIKAEFDNVEADELAARKRVAQTRALAIELTKQVQNLSNEQIEAVNRFRDELETDLNRFNENRLAAYIRLANDISMPAQQKLALAISGWLLGSNNAIENLAVVQSMFVVRDFVREYLDEATTAQRRTSILKELANLESGTPKILDAMIQQMKPIETAANVESYTGESAIEFTVEVPGTAANPEPIQFRCMAHLPPQYNPYRKYPMIVSLTGGTQSLDQNMEIWYGKYNQKLKIRQGNAPRNGYIVVAVDWRVPGQTRWNHSGREHRVVLDALYRSLRLFSVDSDRVFLSGHREGGDGAYDIGISHPEHWAGILGYSGAFDKYINKYWDNIHVQLPLYCVNGQKDVVSIAKMQFAINKWMRPKYINPTIVQYIGRGNELFMEDLPFAFKWMKGQKRPWPDRGGFEFTCNALRPWDTYFWFYELNGIPDDRVVRPELFNQTKKFNKVEISGEITSLNSFRLGPASMKINADSTLWLSPQFADLDKQIQIRGRGSFKGSVTASPKIILDDVLRRADREHIYHAKVDCIKGTWTASE